MNDSRLAADITPIAPSPICQSRFSGRVMRRFLLVIIPLLVLFGATMYFLRESEIKDKTQQLSQREAKGVSFIYYLIMHDLQDTLSEINSLKDNIHLINFINNIQKEDNRLKLIDDLKKLAYLNQHYLQVRLLNNAGKEIIRINNDDKQITSVAEGALQDKSDRLYYKMGKNLKRDELYISTFDINVEKKELQVNKPVIRFVQKIYNNAGAEVGFIVININGNTIFSEINDTPIDMPGEIYIVSSKGTWVRSSKLHDQITTNDFINNESMLPEKARPLFHASNFSDTFSTSWDIIDGSTSGQFHNAEGLFTYIIVTTEAINNFQHDHTILDLSKNQPREQTGEGWYIISHISQYMITQQAKLIDNNYFPMILAMLILILLLSVYACYVWTKRDDTITELNIRFRAIESASNGITIADARAEDMPLIYVNPAFTKITGYTAEEALGRNCRFLHRQAADQRGLDVIRKSFAKGNESKELLLNYKKNGSVFWNELLIAPIRDNNNRTTHYVGIQNDVTERVLAEKALRESEFRYHSLATISPVGMFRADFSGELLYTNERWRELTGVSDNDTESKGWNDIILKSDQEKFWQQWNVSVAMKEVFSLQFRIIHSDGNIKWLWGIARLQEQEIEGKKTYVGIIADITELRETQNELSLFRQLVDHLTDSVFIIETESGNIIDVNESACRSLLYSHETLCTKKIWEIQENINSHSSWEKHLLISATREDTVYTDLHKRNDGSEFPVEISQSNVTLGEVNYTLTVVRNITERRNIENQSREHAKALAIMADMAGPINQSTTAFSLLSDCAKVIAKHLPQASITIWSHNNADEKFKLILHEGAAFENSAPTTRILAESALIENIAKKMTALSINDLSRQPLEGHNWLPENNIKALIALPVMTGDKCFAIIAVYFRDIFSKQIGLGLNSLAVQIEAGVNRLQAVNELHTAKTEAERANKAKAKFLAFMSHEIRTPLNGVISITEMLLESQLKTKQAEYASTILSSSESLLFLINDILDFSKIEAGKLEIKNQKFNLKELSYEVCQLLSARVRLKNIEIINNYPDDCPEVFIGDPLRIRQIILNLAGNAIKFTSNGYVKISFRSTTTDHEQSRIIIEIEDTGSGIPPHAREKIFNMFTQADNNPTSHEEGTGLGLAITKFLTSMMSGTIDFREREGGGTIFQVVLPLAQLRHKAKPGYNLSLLNRLNVALLGSNETNLDIYSDILGLYNIYHSKFKCPSDNEELLTKQMAGTINADVLIIDFTPKAFDKFDFKNIISKFPSAPKYIIGLCPTKLHAQVKSTGFFRTFTKPVTEDNIITALDAVALDLYDDNRSINAREILKESDFTSDYNFKLRILFVDDHVINQETGKIVLGALGCTTDIAQNGKEALELYSESDYDLIFMDCYMPVMGGYTATTEIRKMQKRQNRPHIPIVAMTASAFDDDRKNCLEAGMDEHLCKPVKKSEYIEVIKKLVKPARDDNAAPEDNEKNTSLQPQRQTDNPETENDIDIIDIPETTGDSVRVATSDSADAVVDLSNMLEQIGGNAELMKSLLEKFISSHSEDRVKLFNLFAQKNIKQLSLTAHRMKGAAAILGADKLSETCAKLQVADENTDWEIITDLIHSFKSQSDDVITFVKEQINNA